MFQWNRGRLAALKKFGGANWKDFNVQVDFMAKEAENMIPSWKGQQDLSRAGAIGKAYEGYGDNSTGTRVANANRWAGSYHPSADATAFKGGAAFSAAYHNTSSSNSQSHTTNVNGPITVHTAATDGQGVAAALKASLQRTAAVNPANTGLR